MDVLNIRTFRLLTAIFLTGWLLQGCQSQQQQQRTPPMPPSSTPPSTSSPSPMPTPTQTQSTPKPTTSDSSPSSDSSPTMPSPSSDPTLSPPSPSPTLSDSERQEISDTLKKAGEQLAKAGQQLPAGGESDPLMPEGQQAAGGESDPLMPEGQQAAGGESDPLMPEGQQAAGGESDPLMPEGQQAAGGEETDFSDGEGQWSDAEVSEEILAAREALEQAGIALQTAGTTLENANSDEELAAAQEQLGKARLAVIIAGQDLMDIKGILDDAAIPEDVLADTEKALNDANVAIVIATDLFPGELQVQLPGVPQLGLPQLGLPQMGTPQMGTPGGSPGSAGQSRPGNSELDKELNESIAIFEGKILDARNEVIGNAPPPTTADNIPGVAILGGAGDEGGNEEDGTFDPTTGGSESIFDDGAEQNQESGSPDVASAGNDALPVPEDIPDPQGDDIVAQQLREAAIAETDPELREKLWEEYKRYRANL